MGTGTVGTVPILGWNQSPFRRCAVTRSVTVVMSFNELVAGVLPCHRESTTDADGECRLETESIPPAPQCSPHVRWSIGFTDNSNPFYLFSKLNAGLLLWAPFAPTMREECPLLIALEADSRMLYAKNHNRRTGG
jgi:hypothetical protein